MSILFSPLTIKSVTFKNRIVVSPMCQYSSEDGFANDWHLVHLGSRAVGGAALVIQEATAVSAQGRITDADLGIWKDEHIEKLKTIADFVHVHGSLFGIQLAHAGRKASHAVPWKGGSFVEASAGGWQHVAPSPEPFTEGLTPPHELTTVEIQTVIGDFRRATARAVRVGYDVVEIHAAHGYLINEFLSPLTNHRTDNYGGSFENRSRLLVQIVEAVKKEWPADKPLFVRISASDWAEGGWTIEDSVKLAALLRENGVDLIDCSSGGVVRHQKIPVGPGYQVPFSERVKKDSDILTGAVGMLTDPHQVEEVLASGKADLILMAREFLRDPYFPLHAAKIMGEQTEWPVQYDRAK